MPDKSLIEGLDDYSDFDAMMGMAPDKPATPELGLYREHTDEGKYQRIHNCIYWLKIELRVYLHLSRNNDCSMCRSNLQKLTTKEIARALLEYYYITHFEMEFNNPRKEQMGTKVDLHKFVDLVMDHPIIKKIIADPHSFV